MLRITLRLGVLLCLAVVVGGVLACTNKTDTRPPSSVLTLEVTSDKVGEPIFIDGEELPVKTPATVQAPIDSIVSVGEAKPFSRSTWSRQDLKRWLIGGNERFLHFREESMDFGTRHWLDIGKGEFVVGLLLNSIYKQSDLETVVSQHKNIYYIDELHARNMTSLACLAEYQNIFYLHLEGNGHYDNQWDENTISALQSMSNMRHLETVFSDLDLNLVSKMKHLRELYILDGAAANLGAVSQCRELRKLILTTDKQDLTPLTELQNLTALEIYTSARDLTPITRLSKLNTLTVGLDVSTVPPLAGLTHLENLTIRSGKEYGENPPSINRETFAGMTQLKILTLSSVEISDLQPLLELENLESLTLSSPNVDHLSPLGELAKLTELDLSTIQFKKPSVLTELKNLKRIKKLNCWATNLVDLAPLAKMTDLEDLDLWATDVHDLSPLAELTQLKRLSLLGTQVTDLRPLAGMTQMKYLILQNTKIADLTPLAQMTQMEVLDCWSTEVTDLTPLTNMTKLRELNLTASKVTDLTLLTGLKNLRSLHLRGCPVNQEQVDRLKKQLPGCEIYF